MRERRDLVVLGVASLIFLIGATFLFWAAPSNVYNSPDENANAVFTQEMIGAWRLWRPAATITDEIEDLLRPRSVVVVADRLVPVSFLGLPLFYGLVGKLVGINLIGLLTPLLSVAAIFAWRAIIERLFASRLLALLSALIVLFHPSFWYFSARFFTHNAPMSAFLIFGLFFLISRKQVLFSLAAGVSLGLAFWFRTVEIVWLGPIVIFLFFVFRRTIGWPRLILTAASAVIVLFPLPIFNSILYGSPLLSGYTVGQDQSDINSAFSLPVETSSGQPLFEEARTIARNVRDYALVIFPWFTLAALLGWLVWLPSIRTSPTVRFYLISTALVTIWLFIFYGRWQFYDNPDPTLVTIGNSHVRYWLPVFILWSPLVAQAIIWLSERVRQRLARRLVPIFAVLFLIGLSFPAVFLAEDGLLAIRKNLYLSEIKRERILVLTEEEAIIVVDRADKFVWPGRVVLYPLRDEVTYAVMPQLVGQRPLYYFGITLPSEDVDYLNNEKLAAMNLTVEAVETVVDETLYRIKKTADESEL